MSSDIIKCNVQIAFFLIIVSCCFRVILGLLLVHNFVYFRKLKLFSLYVKDYAINKHFVETESCRFLPVFCEHSSHTTDNGLRSFEIGVEYVFVLVSTTSGWRRHISQRHLYLVIDLRDWTPTILQTFSPMQEILTKSMEEHDRY